jgi:hypothetical protein
MRREHLPPKWRILYNGDRVVVFDANGEIATATIFRGAPDRGRITVIRTVDRIEAILAMLFLEAHPLEIDTSD